MTLRSSLVVAASCVGSLLLAAGTARAIPLPDSSSCSSGGYCLRITNTANGTAITAGATSGFAVSAYATTGAGVYAGASTGIGVAGNAPSGTGVDGRSYYGSGVYAESYAGNGLVAQNNDTNHSAAAVSALSGDAQNGLAYWGTGGIQLTSSIAEKAGGGSWQAFSDARLKKDVTPLRLGLAQLGKLRPVTFKYNGLGATTDDGHEYVGVIAQELEKIFPSMVTSRKGKLHSTDAADTDIKIVDPSAFTYVLINSVKEQQAIIDRLERRIATLEGSRSLAASMVGNGVEMALAFGLLPLGFVALRRRKEPKAT